MDSHYPTVVKNPIGIKSIEEFAVMSDNISKIVFSRTLKNVGPTPLELKQSRNGGSKNILAGSPGLIVTLMQLNLIDEYQLGVHPIIIGSGLRYLKTSRIKLILNS